MSIETLESLIPRPREIRYGAGVFEFTADTRLLLEPGGSADEDAAETLREALREMGLSAPDVVRDGTLRVVTVAGEVLIGDPCRHPGVQKAMREEALEFPDQMSNDGYLLAVTPKRVIVAGIDSSGIYYGVQTLVQLLRACGAELPAVRIRDWPAVPGRGVSMDLYSGEVPTLEALKAYVRRLAHYKLNTLVLYLEDAFLFPSHPNIGEGRDRLTTEEVRDLAEFAARHHVEIIPCYDSPGHMGNTLAHPAWQYLREGEEKPPHHDVINVTHPDTYPLLDDLYSDLCRAFPSSVHYMAGDEALALGTGASRHEAEDVGADALFVRHIKRIREVFSRHGKRIVVSGDPFEPNFFSAFGLENYGLEALRLVPRDVIIAPWHYGEIDSFAFGDELRDLGFDAHLWTSMAAYGTLYPRQTEAAANIMNFVPQAERVGALAVIHSDWNTPGLNTFGEYNWPAAAFFAEWAWTARGRTWETGLQAAVTSFYGPDAQPVTDVIRFLSDLNPYFGWASEGLMPAGQNLFFAPLEPHRVGRSPEARARGKTGGIPAEQAEEGLARFSIALLEARDALLRGKVAASANLDHLDYLDFALEQYEALADLVSARHAMAQHQSGRAKLTELARKLGETLPHLSQRYQELWMRTSRPLGMAPNVEKMQAVVESVRTVSASQA